MARPYGEKFLRELDESEDDSLGVRLARVCVRANLPATYVASALGTTRLTIYSWFRGRQIRTKSRKSVQDFISLIKQAINEDRLPAADQETVRKFIEEITGVPV